VRPISAVRFLFKNQMINSWGGTGRGTVSQKGEAFKPWLRTMAHSEYPSGSACMCAAWTEANRQWYGGSDNMFNFAFPVTAGTSGIEPGVVPAVNMTVGPFATFTIYEQRCGQSRHKAGVHFQQSIDDALANCGILGKTSADLWRAYLAGTVTEPVDVNDRPHFHGDSENSNDGGIDSLDVDDE